MAWTDPNAHIFVTGEIITAANFKTYVTDDLVALRKGITCRAQKTGGNFLIPSGVWTPLLFQADRWDNAALHNTAANTDRFVPPVAGVYHMGACGEFDLVVGGTSLALRLGLNNTAAIVTQQFAAQPANFGDLNVSTDWKCSVGDFLTVEVWQGSGAALTMFDTDMWTPEAWIHFVGEGT